MPQYVKLQSALEARFGNRVRMIMNDPEMLHAHSPDRKWRHGSFEVIDVKTGTSMYTKLGSGLHLTEKQEWVDKFLDAVETECLS